MTQQQPDHALADLALFIALDVRHAIQARLIMWAADAFFEKQPEQRTRFRTNPANTLPYIALAALERQSVVHISETLKDEHGAFPTTATIRRQEDLDLHRDAVSHPATVKWRRKDRQAFFDAQREWKDFRPALIWDLQKSINEELRANGQRTHNEEINVTMAMADMLRSVLALAANDGYAPPETPGLLEWLGKAKERYFAELVGGTARQGTPGGRRAARR